MVISRIRGGLGNQMLIYATGFSLAKDLHKKYKLDISHYNNNHINETPRVFELSFFNITTEIASESEINNYVNKFRSLDKLNNILLGYRYIDYPIQKYLGVKDLYLNGDFFSEKYFINNRNNILKEFTLSKKFYTTDYCNISDRILDKNVSVSMHIRRGDYITNRKANKWHGVLNKDYYINALNRIVSLHKNIYIYVFSDDIEWVKENFRFLPKNCYFVSKHNFNSAQEISLMSLCKHNIIANSSFSWWGAWLNKDKYKLVIAPKKWVNTRLLYSKDIVPKDWYRI